MPNRYKIQRIILIDDSAEDRARLRAALIKGAPNRRYYFREANNGEEGLRLCQPDSDWPVDCVVTDMQMPGMSGLQILQELKTQWEDALPFPVIVLTGTNTAFEEAAEALSLGAQDYITKSGIHYSNVFRSIDNAIERHAMFQKLRASERAAESANRAKSALIGNISHEIRTPMTAVLGLCDILLGEDLTEKHRSMLKMIRDNGTYLVEIVNDLLDLSKIEAGMLQIHPEPLKLPEFLDELINLMKVRADQNQTQLLLERMDIPAAIEADPIRLRQILLNLISNAIKFTQEGEVKLSVSVRKDAPPKLIFAVADTGCGIPEKDQEAIFHPFIQSGASATKSTAGTGLGLSICRRLSQAMGGTISLDSQLGKGSTFTVEIPMIIADPGSPSGVPEPHLSRSVPEILGGCHVLVAEDTRATQVLLRHFIEKQGGKVTLVVNGRQLIDTLQQQPDEYQVIVTDVQMPEVNGLEATQAIRQAGCRIPIIVLTADALAETREAALECGASDVVTKPIEREWLLNRIALHCESFHNPSACGEQTH